MEKNIKNYIIIDNFIPRSYQDAIENVLMDIRWEWNYVNDVTAGNDIAVQNPAPAFKHDLFQNSEIHPSQNGYMDNYHMFFLPMLYCAAEKIGHEVSDIYNGRTFLQTPLEKRKDSSIDPWHIDITVPHTVMLYYVTDNEACTILSEKFWKNENDPQLVECKDMGEVNYIKVQPKKGRMLIFNGYQYHTAETARGKTRCVVNYNVELN